MLHQCREREATTGCMDSTTAFVDRNIDQLNCHQGSGTLILKIKIGILQLWSSLQEWQFHLLANMDIETKILNFKSQLLVFIFQSWNFCFSTSQSSNTLRICIATLPRNKEQLWKNCFTKEFGAGYCTFLVFIFTLSRSDRVSMSH